MRNAIKLIQPALTASMLALAGLAVASPGNLDRAPINIDFEFTSLSMTYADHFLPTTPANPGFTLYQSMTINGSELAANSNPYQASVHTINFAPGTHLIDFRMAQGWVYNDYYRFAPYANYTNNNISFTANTNATTTLGETFRFGTFGISNGITPRLADVNSQAIHLGYRITTHSIDPTLNGFQQTGTLIYDGTSNAAMTPEARADWIWFEGHPELGSTRVFELLDGNNVGAVDLMGYIGSIHLTGFANPTGGAFLVGGVGPINAVPLPGVPALATLGLISLALIRRRVTQPASR